MVLNETRKNRTAPTPTVRAETCSMEDSKTSDFDMAAFRAVQEGDSSHVHKADSHHSQTELFPRPGTRTTSRAKQLVRTKTDVTISWVSSYEIAATQLVCGNTVFPGNGTPIRVTELLLDMNLFISKRMRSHSLNLYEFCVRMTY
jgi:hypothetical protein